MLNHAVLPRQNASTSFWASLYAEAEGWLQKIDHLDKDIHELGIGHSHAALASTNVCTARSSKVDDSTLSKFKTESFQIHLEKMTE